MRSSGIAALGATTTACRTDASDQDRVASAFITAALRLAPVPLPPAERDGVLPAEHVQMLPTELDSVAPVGRAPISAPYQGRHRRRVADRLDFSCQAARS